MKEKKINLGELALLVVSGASLKDVTSLIPKETIVGGIKIQRVFQAEGDQVFVHVRDTDERKPEEVMSLLSKKFGADKVIKACSQISGF